jgi:hypothetical protein
LKIWEDFHLKKIPTLKRTNSQFIYALTLLATFVVIALIVNTTAPVTLQQDVYCKTMNHVPVIASETSSVNTNTPNRHTGDGKEKTDSPLDGRDYMFSQRPYTPMESFYFYTSDSTAGYVCQEDFWDCVDTMCEICWDGLSLIFDGGWSNGDPTGMHFKIQFYKDREGYPGDVVATFSDVEPTPIDTGFEYFGWEMYHWVLWLPSPVSLVQGWISIQSTDSQDGSWFLWAGFPGGKPQRSAGWV